MYFKTSNSIRSSYKPDWWKLRRQPSANIAEQAYGLDPSHRLWMLAIGRAEQGGHAQFGPGEIKSLILKLHAQTGELSEYSDRNIKRWIAKLVEAGLIGTESTAECILLPFPMFDSGVRGNPRPCRVHGHNMNWSVDGWADPEAMWEEAQGLSQEAKVIAAELREAA